MPRPHHLADDLQGVGVFAFADVEWELRVVGADDQGVIVHAVEPFDLRVAAVIEGVDPTRADLSFGLVDQDEVAVVQGGLHAFAAHFDEAGTGRGDPNTFKPIVTEGEHL